MGKRKALSQPAFHEDAEHETRPEIMVTQGGSRFRRLFLPITGLFKERAKTPEPEETPVEDPPALNAEDFLRPEPALGPAQVIPAGIVVKPKAKRYENSLGHAGEPCPFIEEGPRDFVVIAMNGIHELNINFCACPHAPKRHVQLLEIGWWPSTPLDPQSAAPFSLMRHFHTLNLQACCPATDFYRSLERLMDGTGLEKIPDRLAQFMVMVREWRHIKMLRRAGRGHDKTGPLGTKQGGLSVLCRACPHPGVNLPEGWENAPKNVRWLYGLILAQDANFKQKLRACKGDIDDPTLGPGWATFVNEEAYLAYVSKYVGEDELLKINHCVSFAALWLANNKRSKGLRATGVGAVCCARHEMFRPNGMGDLEKGERYSNMDFIFISSIVGLILMMLTISYDIACQWMKNLGKRAEGFPQAFQIPSSMKDNIRFRVPKFHLPAHVVKCHAPFSMNWTRGVGRTCGEGIERLWAFLNGVARSCLMMGHGARRDTLDDFCNFSNWRKTTELGDSLLRKLTLAIPYAVIHHRAHLAFTDGLKGLHAERLVEWEKAVEAWEENPESAPCPYELPEEEGALNDVKKQMAEEEHARVVHGDARSGDLTGSGVLIDALALEEAQRSIAGDARKRHMSTVQATDLQKRRTALLKRILKYQDSLASFMPGLNDYLERRSHTDFTDEPEKMPLYLPSSFAAPIRRRIGPEIRVVAYKYKSCHVASQRSFMRSRELEMSIEVKIAAAVALYNRSREALLALRGPGDWEKNLRVLERGDVRGLNERSLTEDEKETYRKTRLLAGLSVEPVDGELDDLVNIPTMRVNPSLEIGEGHRALSWIWYSIGLRRFLGIRVEWVKCRGRAERAEEEVRFLDEEMRRSLEFCQWKAREWDIAARSRPVSCPFLAEGLVAYAREQQSYEERREEMWRSQWEPGNSDLAGYVSIRASGNDRAGTSPMTWSVAS
ncbi:hypothetical protein C8J56DRAFT_1083227 [Mycena floridula]|nr:hypothetical protein C8J56DRAFT_1083227 [Mycena floridula]